MWDFLEIQSLSRLFKKDEIVLEDLLNQEEIDAISYQDKHSITLANLKSGLKYSDHIFETKNKVYFLFLFILYLL